MQTGRWIIYFLLPLALQAGSARADGQEFLSCNLGKLPPHKSENFSSADKSWQHRAAEILHRLAGDEFSAYLGFIPAIEIITDPFPNAYSHEDHTIVVSSGLLDLFRSDDEFAFVLAHELGHMLAAPTHARQAPDIADLAFLGNLNQSPEALRDEVQADQIGVRLLRGASFHTAAARSLLERLAYQSLQRGGAPTTWVPPLLARIRALERYY